MTMEGYKKIKGYRGLRKQSVLSDTIAPPLDYGTKPRFQMYVWCV